MNSYRIYRNKEGFNLQQDKGKVSRLLMAYMWFNPGYWEENWVTLNVYRTLKAAEKAKEKLLIQEGYVID